MSLAIGIAGVAVLLLVQADFLLTTTGASEHGLVSHRVARATWRGLVRILPDRTAPRIVCGPLLMCAVAAFWIVGTSVAWAMIFQADESAVVRVDGGMAAGWWQDYAFVGHMLSTLGGSLGEPGSTLWAVIAVLAAVNGMVILTLSVSFVLSTTQTVALGRAFLAQADMFSAHGEDAGNALLASLAELTAKMNAAPFALYYSTPRFERRLPEGLVRLLDAARERGDRDFLQRLKIPLSDLPYLDADPDSDDAAFAERLRLWSKGFVFRP